jgi:hypothetical protein
MSSMSINPFSKLDNFSLSVQRTYSIIAATSAKSLGYSYRASVRVALFRARGLAGAVLNAGRPPDTVATGDIPWAGDVVLLVPETPMWLNARRPLAGRAYGCTGHGWGG